VAHIIVIGNEKGGSGKSTTAMHIGVALARMGHKVGALDLDMRQTSLARYIENRSQFAQQEGLNLPAPVYSKLPEIDESALAPGENAFDRRLSMAVDVMDAGNDFILIDCPGNHTRLAQVAHSLADTLVSPLNDSFVDFDLLAKVATDGHTILGPSVYSEMVWQARKMRAQAGLPAIDWLVVRNRLGPQNMINKQKMGDALEVLAKRIGFRTVPGFSERVIFRELFPKGLTLLDLGEIGIHSLSISNVAARQELRDLVKALNLPGVEVTF